MQMLYFFVSLDFLLLDSFVSLSCLLLLMVNVLYFFPFSLTEVLPEDLIVFFVSVKFLSSKPGLMLKRMIEGLVSFDSQESLEEMMMIPSKTETENEPFL